MKLIVEKITFVVTAVKKCQYSFTSFGTVSVISLVSLTVKPLLNALTMLLIVLPLSHILGPVGVNVGPMTVGFVVEPLTIVGVSVRVV